MAPRQRREYFDNATARKNILDAAAELFTQRGFHATSVREIGDHVGIGQSSLYYHAKNKTQILLDINEEFMDGLVAAMDELAAREGSGLRSSSLSSASCCARSRPQGRRHGRAARAPLAAGGGRGEHPGQARPHRRGDRRHPREGIEDGAIRELPVGLTRLAITGMTNWAYTWFDPTGSLSVDEIADLFVDLLRNGVGAPPAPA